MMNDYCYIMVSMTRPYMFKLGVSSRVDLRERQVDARAIFKVRLPWAYKIEAAMHNYLRPTMIRTHGSGKTEWAFCINPILALCLYNAQAWFGLLPWLPPHAALVVLLLPIPLDAILILLCIAIAAYAGIAAVVALSVYALTLLLT